MLCTQIRAFWCRTPSRPNFGDALTPWLIRRLTGIYPTFTPPDHPAEKYLCVGSIIALARVGCVVWGAGIMNRTDTIAADATLLAVRGPLTRRKALDCGARCPDVLGDPAMLLPRLHPPAATVEFAVGLVPHFSDAPRLAGGSYGGAALVDIQAPVEQVINLITACRAVVSSSLHGLIVAHAYGIPAVWVKFRDLPSGDDVKFHDYLASVGFVGTEPVRLDEHNVDVEEVARQATLPATAPDLDLLWESCPFRGMSA